MQRIRLAVLLPLLAACSIESFAVVPPEAVRISAPDPVQADQVRAVLLDVDVRLRERLPGLREWRECDDIIVASSWGVQRPPSFAADRWRSLQVETQLYRWLWVLPDRAPSDLERDVLHGMFVTLSDEAWQAFPECVRRGVCDAVWADGHSAREALLAADAAMALDAGLELAVGDLRAPWMSSHRDLDWGQPFPRALLPQLADGYQMGVHHLAYSAWVGEGCGVGLDWLLARRLLDRQGGVGLQALATAHPGRVPWSALLEAAGLGAHEDAWRAALAGRLDGATLTAVVRTNARRLAQPVAALARSNSAMAGFDEMLVKARPRLRSPEGAEVLLDEVPEALAALREAWIRQAALLDAASAAP